MIEYADPGRLQRQQRAGQFRLAFGMDLSAVRQGLGMGVNFAFGIFPFGDTLPDLFPHQSAQTVIFTLTQQDFISAQRRMSDRDRGRQFTIVPFGIGALDDTAVGQRSRYQPVKDIPLLQGCAAHGIGLADAAAKAVIGPAKFVLKYAIGAIDLFFKGASIEAMAGHGFGPGHALGVGLPAGSGQGYRVGKGVLGDTVCAGFSQHIAPVIKGAFSGQAQGRNVFVTGIVSRFTEYSTQQVIFGGPGGIGLTAVGLFFPTDFPGHAIEPDSFLTSGSADSGLAALVR